MHNMGLATYSMMFITGLFIYGLGIIYKSKLFVGWGMIYLIVPFFRLVYQLWNSY